MPERRSVLIVDDDARFSTSLTQLLSGSGYRVAQAEDAGTARHLVGNKAFHVAVVDLNLPRDNGIELIRWLSQKKKRMKIVAVTGVESDLYLEIATYCGAHVAVRKFDSARDDGFPDQQWLNTIAAVLTGTAAADDSQI